MLRVVLYLSFVFLTSSAHAWIPPTHAIIKALSKKHAPLTESRFVNKVTVFKHDGEIARVFIENLQFQDTEHVVIQLTKENGAPIITKNRNLESKDRPVSYDLLFVKNMNQIFDRLKNIGLPLLTEAEIYSQKEGNLPYKIENGHVAYSRFGNKSGVVVADNVAKEALDRGQIQLWFERNSYLPIRAVLPLSSDSELVDYRFEQYRSEGGFLYPNTIEIFKEGARWIKIENRSAKVGKGSFKAVGSSHSEDQDSFYDYYLKWIR